MLSVKWEHSILSLLYRERERQRERQRETERETERERDREREKAGRCGSAGGGVGRVSVPPVRSGLV